MNTMLNGQSVEEFITGNQLPKPLYQNYGRQYLCVCEDGESIPYSGVFMSSANELDLTADFVRHLKQQGIAKWSNLWCCYRSKTKPEWKILNMSHIQWHV